MARIEGSGSHDLVWYVATVMALVGVVGTGAGWQPAGIVLSASGFGLLAGLAVASTVSLARASSGKIVGGSVGFSIMIVAVLAAIVIGSVPIVGTAVPTEVRLAALATAVQAILFVISIRPANATRTTRWIVPVSGHGTVIFGTTLLIGLIPFASWTPYLLYTVGFSFLALHAFWMRLRADERVVPIRPDTPGRRWSVVLTVAIVGGVLAAGLTEFTISAGELVVRPDGLIPDTRGARAAAVVSGLAAVAGFSTLADPPEPPRILDAVTGPTSTVLQHALTLIVLLNALLIAVLVAIPEGFRVLFGLFLTYLVGSVTVEYLSVVHGRRLRRRIKADSSSPPLRDDPPVTVVVSAFNDANVLEESLSHNLEALDTVPFVIVPAVRSTDATVEVAEEYAAEYPDRARVIKGTGGSKAADLNLVWEAIDTAFVLVLDSDETVETELIARGLETFETRPEVGIIQGRKVSENPGTSALSRFTSLERQQSTWLEHPYMDDRFGAGHFGGSVALIRREVPPSVDGWKEGALTEDIEFTVRLQLESEWEVAYDPAMIGREATPERFRDLISQRQRWTRGWAEVAESYLGTILRSPAELGWKRSIGFSWLLFTSISAPLATVFPALLLLGSLGYGGLPPSAAVGLAVFLLPARAISFGYAAFRDPEVPLSRTPRNVGGVLLYGYLWFLFGWIVQIHSLYLELAGAPNTWHVTRKRTRGVDIRNRSRVPRSTATFEVYRDTAGEWRWRLLHDNGNVIADSGEGYERYAGCINGLDGVKRTVSDAAVLELEDDGESMKTQVGVDGGAFEVYRDAANEWRWRLLHNNGNVIADSGEGYERLAGSKNGLRSVRDNAPTAPVVNLEVDVLPQGDVHPHTDARGSPVRSDSSPDRSTAIRSTDRPNR